MNELSHFDESGASRMVDVGEKEITQRSATAMGIVVMQPQTADLIQNRGMSKGDVLEVARLAGIMAAKKTSDLIPLCHPLPITSAKLDFHFISSTELQILAEVRVSGRTGVEMEALTAVSIAALTVYDMCKAVDREMTFSQIQLMKKSGGKSADYVRDSQTSTTQVIS